MTLREYIIFWQETYDKQQSRPTTYAAHNYVFKNHILPGLGDTQLSELTSEMVGEFLEERKRFGNHRTNRTGLGEETMRHIHRLLQQCLDQAIRDGLITENPAKAFHYRKSTTVKANIMTPLEMEDYLDAAEQLGYLPMFMLALTAGLRQGELIALKWSDLDIESRTLTVAENRAVVRRELVEYGSQTRSIKLTPEVVNLLIMEHRKHPSNPLMFMHPATQKPFSPQMVRRMHNEIIQDAGIDHIRYVDLRHTCAILALKNGTDAKELAQMLGHYSLAKLYLSDDLEVRDIRTGMDWLYTAAVNGSHYAMYRLAKECRKGELIEKDIAHAVEWFTKSAERGNQYAQYMLGKLYLTGKEVPYDEERAVHWLTRSAEQDNQYAQYLLDHLEENRPPSVMLAMTRLLHHMSRIFQDNSVPKSHPGGIQIDRKRLKKLQEKRIALGHKPDDHEEQWPDMTM